MKSKSNLSSCHMLLHLKKRENICRKMFFILFVEKQYRMSDSLLLVELTFLHLLNNAFQSPNKMTCKGYLELGRLTNIIVKNSITTYLNSFSLNYNWTARRFLLQDIISLVKPTKSIKYLVFNQCTKWLLKVTYRYEYNQRCRSLLQMAQGSGGWERTHKNVKWKNVDNINYLMYSKNGHIDKYCNFYQPIVLVKSYLILHSIKKWM